MSEVTGEKKLQEIEDISERNPEILKPDRWLADFEKADFRDEVRPPILKENAVKLFGL